MLRINNRGFKRSYVYGGTGIFDSIAKAAVSLLPVVQKGALQVGKKLGEKGVQKVSSLVSKSRDKPSKSEETKLITFRSGPKDPERSFAGPLYPERSFAGSSDPKRSFARLTSKSQDILRKYTAPPPPPSEQNFNLNALIDGSAIRIEDYIKRLKK